MEGEEDKRVQTLLPWLVGVDEMARPPLDFPYHKILLLLTPQTAPQKTEKDARNEATI
jgi:hypothetical protein